MMEMDSNTETSLFDSHEEQADIAGPTVSSLRKLVQDYFRLIDYTQRVNLDEGKSDTADSTAFNGEIRTLDDLPRLINYSSHAVIHNREKFLEAVHSQRWSLLSKMSSQQCLQNTPSIRTAHRVEKPFSLCGNHGDHETPLELFVAILKAGGDRPIVLDFLLRAGFDPNEFISDEGLQWPLLVYAVRLRRLHVVQALLDAGAHPDSLEPGPKRRTALGVAIAAGDVDMANLLILAGANFYEVRLTNIHRYCKVCESARCINSIFVIIFMHILLGHHVVLYLLSTVHSNYGVKGRNTLHHLGRCNRFMT